MSSLDLRLYNKHKFALCAYSTRIFAIIYEAPRLCSGQTFCQRGALSSPLRT
jgi:hypothetical protein